MYRNPAKGARIVQSADVKKEEILCNQKMTSTSAIKN